MEKAEASREQEAGIPAPERLAAENEKAEKPHRGRPPKSDKTERPGPEAEKDPPKGRSPKGRAPLRLTRRPPARPSSPNETNLARSPRTSERREIEDETLCAAVLFRAGRPRRKGI